VNRLALAASLLLWGWHLERPWLALALLAIAELCGRQRRRWHLGDGDWQRVLLVAAVLLVASTVYAANVADLPAALFEGLSWLPVALFPLIVAQRLSADPGVPLSVFLAAPAPGKYLDFALPFAAATFLAAAAANSRSTAFLPALAGALAVALWPLRRAGVHPAAWAATLGVVVALGFGAANVLGRIQEGVQDWVMAWLASDTLETDSERTMTRIGSIGRIKLSGKVVLRVQPDGAARAPMHLVEATYDDLRGGTLWQAPAAAPRPLAPGPTTWELGGAPGAGVRIEARLADGRGVLPLPIGATRIRGLAAERAERNRLGTVRVGGAAPTIFYRAEGGGDLPGPGDGDLGVPALLAPVLRQVDAELGLSRLPPGQRIAALTRFFEGYRYTLDAGGESGRSLAQFLTVDRAGHCEYFASATTLLLRQSGVPARYAVGFLAHDYSPLERALLVRARDAHAWSMAYVDGRWQVADTTPASWPELEAAGAPFWDPVALLASRAWFAAQQWWEQDADAPLKLGGAAILIGLLVLTWLWTQQRSEAARTAAPAGDGKPRDALAGSAFAPVAQRLEAVSPQQGPHETARQWAARAELHARVRASGPLGEIVDLLYRHRYGPGTARDDGELRRKAREWAARFDAGR
jgi:transglutaminase-like putative cysteine protease